VACRSLPVLAQQRLPIRAVVPWRVDRSLVRRRPSSKGAHPRLSLRTPHKTSLLLRAANQLAQEQTGDVFGVRAVKLSRAPGVVNCSRRGPSTRRGRGTFRIHQDRIERFLDSLKAELPPDRVGRGIGGSCIAATGQRKRLRVACTESRCFTCIRSGYHCWDGISLMHTATWRALFREAR
jgi:hypothetical protein